MTRLRQLIVPLLALLALLAVVVGVPIALVVLVGSPVPSPVPTLAELGDVAAGRAPIPADWLIAILAVVMWILWAQVAVAAFVEGVAAYRGRLARNARLLPGVQLGVGKLVTASTFLLTALTVKPVNAAPLMPVTVGPVEEGPASATAEDPVSNGAAPTAATVAYNTVAGDTWWGIAEDHLGHGQRWKELRSLNLGRSMEDGTVISTATDLLRPNWRLLLPGSAGGSGVASDRSVVVEPGDTIWGIADADLGAGDSDHEIAEHVDRIVDDNRGTLDGNPDLIYPGQRLVLPPLADRATTDAVPTPAPGPADPESGTPSSTTPAAPTSTPTTAAPSSTAQSTTAAPSTTAPPPTTAAPTSTAAPTTDGSPSTTASPTSTTAAPSSTAAPATDDAEGGASDGSGGDAATGPTPQPVGEDRALPSSNRATFPGDASIGEPPSLAGATAETPGFTLRPLGTEQDLGRSGDFRRTPTDDAPVVIGQPDGSASQDQDLPTVGELSEADVMAGRAMLDGEGPDGDGLDGDGLDTETSRAPVFAGLAAITLLGGYLFRARKRRRTTALRQRHPGRRPQTPKRKTRKLSRRLAAAAEPDHPEFVNVGLRALGRQLQTMPATQLPKISGIWVSHNRLVIAFEDDSPRSAPPEPFTEFADGSGWTLRRSEFEHARRIARGANGPLPLLATVGTTTALDLALTTNSRGPADAYGLSSSLLFAVDLEVGRVISVQASDESTAIETMTMMALELATSETADQAEIVCVGFGHRLATFDRVMVVDDISEILSDLETITSRALYAAADASPFATRVGNGAADTWNPVIVFHADASDQNAETLIELADQTEGGVTAVCAYPTGAGWTFLVDGERIRCPNLPGDLAEHNFTRPELDGVELIADLFDEPWEQVDLDEDFWAPMDAVEADHTWHLQESSEQTWRPMSPVTERDRPAAVDQDDRQRSLPVSVVVNEGEIESTAPPDELWDSIATVDPDAWPATSDTSVNELPALRPLRHSVEHRPPSPPADLGTGGDGDEDLDVTLDLRPPRPAEVTPPRHLHVVGGSSDPTGNDSLDDETAGDGPADNGRVVDDGAVADGADNDRADDDRADDDRADDDRADDARADDERADPAAETGDDVTDEALDEASDTAAGETVVDVDPVAVPPTAVGLPTAVDADAASDPASEDVRVSVLGTFTIEGHHVGDRSKPWKYTKTPELILYLLLHPGGASQDLLMEQLFPEQPPNRPRLNQLVSDARTKALGKNRSGDYHLPHASPTEPFYKLLGTVSFDLREFTDHCARARAAESILVQQREWKAALELVRGRPFTLPNDGYEWALPEVEATIVKVEEAAAALADIAIELGDYDLAVWATKQGLQTGTGYYELLAKRGRAALLSQDPEEIVRAFADLQVSLDYSGAPEEGMPDFSSHPELQDVFAELQEERNKDRRP